MRFDDGSALRLYRQTIEDFGLYPGKEISDQELVQLKESAGAMSAKMRAIRIVAASSVSKKDLQRRLVTKGEDPEQAESAVQWMSDLGLVDDKRVAEQIVNRCISKGYGLAKARQMLYEKQIPRHYWDDVLSDYPEQLDAIMQYLRENLDEDADQRSKRRAIEVLIRKGHPYSNIRKAIGQLSYDTDDFPEE